MEIKEALQKLWPNEIQDLFREELETAWLRGFARGKQEQGSLYRESGILMEAADYAERVVGGSTAPTRPGVE
jgi:hypothetical protein